MHYRIVTPPHIGAAHILRQTIDWLREDKAMQADRVRLTKACCAPASTILRVLHCPRMSASSAVRLGENWALIAP